ncbi:MAG: hypothetical protein QM676_00395 [Novosphingobium sp.]
MLVSDGLSLQKNGVDEAAAIFHGTGRGRFEAGGNEPAGEGFDA